MARNGVIALFRFSEKCPLVGVAGKIDWRLGGHLSRLLIDDFFTGAPLESLLFPMGRKLFDTRLLLIGLGSSAEFDRTCFDLVMTQLFTTLQRMESPSLTLALPGRPEGRIDSSTAMEWCLDYFDRHTITDQVTIIETVGAQQIMTPTVERWRMKHSVPSQDLLFFH